MTNEELFKTTKERTEGFRDFCRNYHSCLSCPLYTEKSRINCNFAWLKLEADKLNSCPFCGSEKIKVFLTTKGSPFFVSCTNCHARTPLSNTLKVVIDAWNRRA